MPVPVPELHLHWTRKVYVLSRVCGRAGSGASFGLSPGFGGSELPGLQLQVSKQETFQTTERARGPGPVRGHGEGGAGTVGGVAASVNPVQAPWYSEDFSNKGCKEEKMGLWRWEQAFKLIRVTTNDMEPRTQLWVGPSHEGHSSVNRGAVTWRAANQSESFRRPAG